ncbi:hypothetical protein KC351_g2835 [Hortaea werneckii]|nr:hypothetical protein KC351_g2835 [Hortaea werneckii]
MLEEFDSAPLLDDMTVTQLNRSNQLTGNPIKERFGDVLYNFFIIDPEQVNNDLGKAYDSAKAIEVRRGAFDAVLGGLQRR